MINKQTLYKYYPKEKYDGTKKFYDYIRSFIRDSFVVLNLGAGKSADRKIRSLKGEVKLVYGADIDDIVLDNSDLDIKVILKSNDLPFENNFFDLVWSDYVLEHVEDPDVFLSEIYRVIKPNGTFIFRTPNKYHYVSIISRLTPHWFHELFANKVRGLPTEHDIHKTFYRLNSSKQIKQLAKDIGFKKTVLQYIETEPSYLLFSYPTFYVGFLYERLVNSSDFFKLLRSNIIGCLYK